MILTTAKHGDAVTVLSSVFIFAQSDTRKTAINKLITENKSETTTF